ncbi:MAG TPA: trigger factor [Candidatus Brocadiia bacterium]|nr:trigger factor [Candidatus Brocadiia bacterium]
MPELREAGPLQKVVVIDLPGQKVREQYETMFKDLAGAPGVNPDEIPESEKEQIRKDVRDKLIRQMFQDAVKESKLKILGNPGYPKPDGSEIDDAAVAKVEIPFNVWECQLTELGSCRRNAHIKTPVAELDARYKTKINELCDGLELPGFRRGKAPKGLIEKRMGKLCRRDVKAGIISDLFQELHDEGGFRLVGMPEYPDVDKMPEEVENIFEFDVVFDIWPEVEPPPYKGLKISRPSGEFTPEKLDEQLHDYLERMTPTEEAPADSTAEGDDYLNCAYVLTIDGAEVRRKDSDAYAFMGINGLDGINIAGLKEALLGAKIGDTREVETDFPETEPDKALAGKHGKFAIKVNSIKRRPKRELNDETAKFFGYDNLTAMRADFKERFQRGLENQIQQTVRRQAEDALLASAQFDLPESLVELQTQRNVQRTMSQLMRNGMPIEQIQTRAESIAGVSREEAVRSFRLSAILEKIADAEKIFVTENQISATIENLARAQSVAPQALWRHMEREELLSALRRDLREQAVVDFLIEKAEIENIDVNAEPTGEKAEG